MSKINIRYKDKELSKIIEYGRSACDITWHLRDREVRELASKLPLQILQTLVKSEIETRMVNNDTTHLTASEACKISPATTTAHRIKMQNKSGHDGSKEHYYDGGKDPYKPNWMNGKGETGEPRPYSLGEIPEDIEIKGDGGGSKVSDCCGGEVEDLNTIGYQFTCMSCQLPCEAVPEELKWQPGQKHKQALELNDYINPNKPDPIEPLRAASQITQPVVNKINEVIEYLNKN